MISRHVYACKSYTYIPIYKCICVKLLIKQRRTYNRRSPMAPFKRTF